LVTGDRVDQIAAGDMDATWLLVQAQVGARRSSRCQAIVIRLAWPAGGSAWAEFTRTLVAAGRPPVVVKT
jgi:hypothetical protein